MISIGHFIFWWIQFFKFAKCPFFMPIICTLLYMNWSKIMINPYQSFFLFENLIVIINMLIFLIKENNWYGSILSDPAFIIYSILKIWAWNFRITHTKFSVFDFNFFWNLYCIKIKLMIIVYFIYYFSLFKVYLTAFYWKLVPVMK